VVNAYPGRCAECGKWLAKGAGEVRLRENRMRLICTSHCGEQRGAWTVGELFTYLADRQANYLREAFPRYSDLACQKRAADRVARTYPEIAYNIPHYQPVDPALFDGVDRGCTV
jgi:hypothetical protein